MQLIFIALISTFASAENANPPASKERVMPTLSILRLGHPALRRKSDPVTLRDLESKDFQHFLDDLAHTCLENNGAGIAAPQVGVNKRVVVVNVDANNPRYPNRPAFPLTILVNPKVVARSSEEEEDWEGDLSAGIRAIVPRALTCTVEGIDRNGKKLRFELIGFHARVFQHEIDHLDGILLLDRVRRKETLSELPEWEKYWKGKNADKVISDYAADLSFK